MGDDPHFSYAISPVAKIPFEVRGSLPSDIFRERIMKYNPSAADFIVYRQGSRVEEQFKYGDPYNANDCRTPVFPLGLHHFAIQAGEQQERS